MDGAVHSHGWTERNGWVNWRSREEAKSRESQKRHTDDGSGKTGFRFFLLIYLMDFTEACAVVVCTCS